MSERFELGCLHSTNISLENSLLGMSSNNNFRVPDHQSHVAQQSRREKLRVPPTPHHQTSASGSGSAHHHHIQDLGNHLLQLPIRYSSNQGDFVHVRSINKNNCDLLYDPTPMFSSEMLNFSSSHHHHQQGHHHGHVLLAHKQDVVLQHHDHHAKSGKAAAAAAAVGPVPPEEEEENTTTVSTPSSHNIVPTNFRFHQSQQQQQNCDWMSNFGGVGGGGCNQNPILIGGEILPPPPRNTKQTDFFSVAPVYMKSAAATVAVAGSGCNSEYQEEDVQSPLTTTTTTTSNNNRRSSDISNQKSYGEVNFSRSPLFYQTNLQESTLVTSSSTSTTTLGGGTQGGGGFQNQMGSVHHVQQQQQQQQKIRETGHGSWVDGGNELVLLPNYGNHQNNHPSQLLMEEVEEEGSTHQWNGSTTGGGGGGGGNLESIVGTDSTTNQGLSLSLSSYPILAPELHAAPHQFGERFGSENMQTRPAMCSDSQDSKPNDACFLVSNSKSSNTNIDQKGHGNSVEGGIGGCSAAYARHCTGPLGPFTGYATILKNSKFLKPAQQLLEEFCSVTGPKIIKSCEVVDNSSKDVCILSDALNSDNGDAGSGRDGNSGGSSSFFSTSNAAAAAGSSDGRVGSRPCQSYRPDFQQKKAKLMYMLEEVCRRYKQYHQQMQMVVSSFETVAGLDAATPYTSLALKTVSKHFRSLKNTIADQLSLMRKALGEDLSSPTSGTNSNKSDATVPRLRFINQSLGKQGDAGNSLGFLEPQQQVWRPQRGLPERSVAVLKAWLFEHFLHPYPTDTDKHMLASQTGLTRNQVSNWFINARVRVWKPMVEEMHMLETKGTTETDLNSGKSIQKPGGDVSGRTSDQSSNMLMINAMSEKVPECSTMGITSNPEVGQSSEHWHQEKRSRMECQIQPGVLDGGLMGFVPYHHQRALEIGGIGSVSLTLGLRHSTGNVQQQQQHHHHPDHQLSRHYGGQMLHDFVG